MRLMGIIEEYLDNVPFLPLTLTMEHPCEYVRALGAMVFIARAIPSMLLGAALITVLGIPAIIQDFINL